MTVEEAAKENASKYASNEEEELMAKYTFIDGVEWQRNNDNTIRSNNKEALSNALEQLDKYRWHDLRKNPDDLPKVQKEFKKEGFSDYVLVYFDKDELSCSKPFHQTVFYDYSNESWNDKGNGDIIDRNAIAWMEIPTFDEILEANKDVLKRLREK